MRHYLLLLFLLLSLPIVAQPVIGVKGGLNVANINGATGFFDPRIGFHAGVFAAHDLSRKFSLQAELLYSQKGFRNDAVIEVNQGRIQKVRFRFNYTHLDIPLVLKYRLFNRFAPYAGPQASLMIRSNASVRGIPADSVMVNSQSGLTVGVVAGLGYRITNRLGADVRYNRDLSGSGIYNHAFQLGLSFGLLPRESK